ELGRWRGAGGARPFGDRRAVSGTGAGGAGDRGLGRRRLRGVGVAACAVPVPPRSGGNALDRRRHRPRGRLLGGSAGPEGHHRRGRAAGAGLRARGHGSRARDGVRLGAGCIPCGRRLHPGRRGPVRAGTVAGPGAGSAVFAGGRRRRAVVDGKAAAGLPGPAGGAAVPARSGLQRPGAPAVPEPDL
ncbi:MAG: Colicin V production protein, partial [uncultured Acetobacteraceae bacterium]